MSSYLDKPFISKVIFCSYTNSAISTTYVLISCLQNCFFNKHDEQLSRYVHWGCLQKYSMDFEGCFEQDGLFSNLYAFYSWSWFSWWKDEFCYIFCDCLFFTYWFLLLSIWYLFYETNWYLFMKRMIICNYTDSSLKYF